MNDSAEYKFKKFGVSGNSEQETSTQSNNIFNPSKAVVRTVRNWWNNIIEYTTNNTSVTIDENNYLHGTASTYLVIVMPFKFEKDKTIYNKTSKLGNSLMVYNSEGKNISEETTFLGNVYTPKEDFSGYLGIKIDENVVTDDSYIMISYENASYEPFKPNMPSPDFPSKIHNAGENGSVNLKVQNEDKSKEQTITIETQEEMLEDDYFDFENETENHIWKKYILDGSEDENWTLTRDLYFLCTHVQGESYIYNTWEKVVNTSGLSSIGVLNYEVLERQTGYGLALAYGFRLNLENIDAANGATVEQLRAYLAENPITVYVKLKDKRVLQMTENQKESKKQIDELHSYYGTTHITCEDETSCNFDIEYVQDINLVRQNDKQELEDRIQKVEQAIVALGGV